MKPPSRSLGFTLLTLLALWCGSDGTATPALAFQLENLSAPPGEAAPDPLAAGNPDPRSAPSLVDDQPPQTFLAWVVRYSGIFGFMLLLMGLVLAALILKSLGELRRELFVPAAFLEQFERLLDEKNYQAAYEAAKGNESFVGQVLAVGMARLGRSYDDAQQGMQEAGDRQTLVMEQSIGYLSLIGTVAPLLGLLGTVQGLAMNLQVMANANVVLRLSEFAPGIATALLTTMEGLIVAIPAIVCYVLFKNRLARLVMEAGHVSDELLRRFQGVARASIPVTSRPTVASTL